MNKKIIMKTMIMLLLLLISFIKVQAQETDSLGNTFKIIFDESIQREKQKAYTTDYFNNDFLSKNKIIKVVLNTTIEESALEFMYQNCKQDSLLCSA